MGTPVSSTNKTDRHYIAEILFKLALNTINQLLLYSSSIFNIAGLICCFCFEYFFLFTFKYFILCLCYFFYKETIYTTLLLAYY